MKDWDNMSLSEKISSLPDRHPFPVKAMLYIAIFQYQVPWEAVHQVLRTMGYIPIEVSEDFELDTAFGPIRGQKIVFGWTTEPVGQEEDSE